MVSVKERAFITAIFVLAEIPNVLIPHPQQALFLFLGIVATAATWFLI